MKKFKEFTQINESEASYRKTSEPRVFDVDVINDNICNLIHRQAKKGLKPYYLNDYGLEEILTNKEGNPYKIGSEKKSNYGRPLGEFNKQYFKYKPNPFGTFYFLTEDELEKMKPITDQIKVLMSKVDKFKETLVDLIGSNVQHGFDKKEEVDNEEV
jgi:hypothetical protein